MVIVLVDSRRRAMSPCLYCDQLLDPDDERGQYEHMRQFHPHFLFFELMKLGLWDFGMNRPYHRRDDDPVIRFVRQVPA